MTWSCVFDLTIGMGGGFSSDPFFRPQGSGNIRINAMYYTKNSHEIVRCIKQHLGFTAKQFQNSQLPSSFPFNTMNSDSAIEARFHSKSVISSTKLREQNKNPHRHCRHISQIRKPKSNQILKLTYCVKALPSRSLRLWLH